MSSPEDVNPSTLPRGHPLREKFEGESKMRIMEGVEAHKLGISDKMSRTEGENEKVFRLHHEFINQGVSGVLSPEFAESMSKLLALSNFGKDEIPQLEYHFDILVLKEFNYSKKREYTPAKSRVIEIMRMYYYAQIRRARGGWEREMEVTERKTLRSEVPTVKKKSGGLFGKLFGGG